MTEYRTVSFMQPLGTILGTVPGSVAVSTIDFLGSAPELAEYVDGWEVVNSQIIPAGEHVYVVLFMRTTVTEGGVDSLPRRIR